MYIAHSPKEELKDFIMAAIVLIIVFLLLYTPIGPITSLKLIAISYIIGGVLAGFLLHELAHRMTARKLGYIAFFKAWKFGLLISLLTALAVALLERAGIFIPIVFLAPGAVYIYPSPFTSIKTPRELAHDEFLIASAGPMTNIVIAAVAYALSLIPNIFLLLMMYVAQINAMLAVFNLLPLPMFDGLKIFRTNPGAWIGLFIIAGVLFLLSIHISWIF